MARRCAAVDCDCDGLTEGGGAGGATAAMAMHGGSCQHATGDNVSMGRRQLLATAKQAVRAK